jgi:hypothetical protein
MKSLLSIHAISRKSCTNLKTIFICTTCILIFYIFYSPFKELEPSCQHFFIENQVNLTNKNFFKLQSKCDCRKEIIYVSDIENKIFTCDFYNTLRRGKGQKEVSYSLYGSNSLYYNEIKSINRVKLIYEERTIDYLILFIFLFSKSIFHVVQVFRFLLFLINE